jgi:hypothetical protein
VRFVKAVLLTFGGLMLGIGLPVAVTEVPALLIGVVAIGAAAVIEIVQRLERRSSPFAIAFRGKGTDCVQYDVEEDYESITEIVPSGPYSSATPGYLHYTRPVEHTVGMTVRLVVTNTKRYEVDRVRLAVTDLVGVRALDEPTSLRRHWLKLIHENDPPYQVSVAGASLEPDHELLFDLAAKRLPDPSAVIYLELAAQHLRDDLPLPAGEYQVSVEATGRLPTGDAARSKTERFRLWVQDAGELAVERIS